MRREKGCRVTMWKKIKIILFSLIALIVLLLLASWTYHSIKITKEKKDNPPIGEMVEVNGHDMHVYVDGDGEQTIVFLAGGGTSAPTIDFKPLWSFLVDEYQIAVVEKAGYGWSAIANVDRDMDTILEETRTALQEAGQSPPYVLAPHSMSGLEAIRWAQLYPDEVEAMIGLDAAVPEAYEVMDIPSSSVQSLASFAARAGVLRLIPSVLENSAGIDSGNLSAEDEKVYRALFHQSTLTKNMVEEVKQVESNAQMVNEGSIPREIPMYFFISNGEEVGLDQWSEIATDYLHKIDQKDYMHMGDHHYIHAYEPKKIAKEIKRFLDKLE